MTNAMTPMRMLTVGIPKRLSMLKLFACEDLKDVNDLAQVKPRQDKQGEARGLGVAAVLRSGPLCADLNLG